MLTRTIYSILSLIMIGSMVYLGVESIPSNKPDLITSNADSIANVDPDNYQNVISKTEESQNFELKDSSLPGTIDVNFEASNKFNEGFYRLLELEEDIDSENKRFNVLITAYDKDLGNNDTRQALSSALLNSKEYRSNLIEKFKIKREFEKVN